MDKLRRWLLDLRKDNSQYHTVMDDCCCQILYDMAEDDYGIECCEKRSLDNYLTSLRRQIKQNQRVVTDEECLEYYDHWCDVLMEEKTFEMSERLQMYEKEKSRAVFGCSMEYMRGERFRALRELLECCCVNRSHTKIHDDAVTMEGYRRELPIMVDDETLTKYAFFRRFFGYCDERYTLSDRVMMARHLMMNCNGRESILHYLECYCMMMIIQGEMDELCVGEEYRLSEIEGFNPHALLEYVGRVACFAKDPEEVRRRWCELMFRSNEIVRRYGSDVRECLVEPKGDFSKMFVQAVIGLMKKEYGYYNATYKEMAARLEHTEIACKRAERYMNRLLASMSVKPASAKVIRAVMG